MIFLNVRTRFCCHIDLLTHREAVISEQLVTASLRFTSLLGAMKIFTFVWIP